MRVCLWSILLAGKQADGSPAYIRLTLSREKRLWKWQQQPSDPALDPALPVKGRRGTRSRLGWCEPSQILLISDSVNL